MIIGKSIKISGKSFMVLHQKDEYLLVMEQKQGASLSDKNVIVCHIDDKDKYSIVTDVKICEEVISSLFLSATKQ